MQPLYMTIKVRSSTVFKRCVTYVLRTSNVHRAGALRSPLMLLCSIQPFDPTVRVAAARTAGCKYPCATGRGAVASATLRIIIGAIGKDCG